MVQVDYGNGLECMLMRAYSTTPLREKSEKSPITLAYELPSYRLVNPFAEIHFGVCAT
jgi:hypothetical protein